MLYQNKLQDIFLENPRELDHALIICSTDHHSRKRLLETSIVKQIKEGFDSGRFVAADLIFYVEGILREMEYGRRLPKEYELVAITVALEGSKVRFAEEFLKELSELQMAELSFPTRLARLCLAERNQQESL